MLKQRRDSISQYEAAGRQDLADVEKFEISVLQTYMPQQMSEAEIAAAIEAISRVPAGAEITVHTDSQYLYGTVTKNWQRKMNRDLWTKLDEVTGQRKVHWQWTDQTAKNPLHLEAHSMATALASQSAMPITPPPAPAKKLTHVDAAGRPKMVDIGEKADTERQAIARGVVKTGCQGNLLAEIS